MAMYMHQNLDFLCNTKHCGTKCLNLNDVMFLLKNFLKFIDSQQHMRGSIPVGCVLPPCKPYALQCPPPDVAPGLNKFEQVSSVGHQMSVAE